MWPMFNTWKLVNLIHHITEIKDNYGIISIDAEKSIRTTPPTPTTTNS